MEYLNRSAVKPKSRKFYVVVFVRIPLIQQDSIQSSQICEAYEYVVGSELVQKWNLKRFRILCQWNLVSD